MCVCIALRTISALTWRTDNRVGPGRDAGRPCVLHATGLVLERPSIATCQGLQQRGCRDTGRESSFMYVHHLPACLRLHLEWAARLEWPSAATGCYEWLRLGIFIHEKSGINGAESAESESTHDLPFVSVSLFI